MAKEKRYFKDLKSLQPIVKVLNEASEAVADPTRTINESAIPPEVIAAALGAGTGGVITFSALYGLGMVGLSAAGITSGLSAAGAVLGGGMVAGIFVLAAPITVLALGGVGIASHLKEKQAHQKCSELHDDTIRVMNSVEQAIKKEGNASKERLDYLRALGILLERAKEELEHDLFQGE